MGKIEDMLKLFYKHLSVMVVLLIIASSCALSSTDDPVTFHGRVTDTSGNGLADVEVGVYFSRDTAFVSTDKKGNFRIKIPLAGRIDLFIRKEGYTTYNERFFLLGGHKEQVDLVLKTLSEDAYLYFNPQKIVLNNYGGYASVQVESNLNYEIESQPAFLQCTPSPKSIFIMCDSNYTSEERSGMVIIKAEYGVRDTLFVTQKAGPILVIENHFAKAASTFLINTPQVVFSESIEIIAVESNISNLEYELSEDKKTINFKNTGINLFESIPLIIWVKTAENIPIEFKVTFRMYINNYGFTQRFRESSFFTADNQYLWLYNIEMNNEKFQLKQFTTSDFRVSISLTLDGFNGMSYNPYNNCLYLSKQVFLQGREFTELHLYNANSGEFVQKLTIDFNSATVYRLQFCRNGLGVMFVGENMLYLDSKNGHEYGVIPGSLSLYDSSHPDELIPNNVATCNDFNLFLLYGQSSSGRYIAYSVDPETMVIKSLYSSTINNFVTNNSSPYAFYFSSEYNKIVCQNLATAALKTLDINKTGIANLAVIESDNEMPDLYCSDNSIFKTSINQSFSLNIPVHNYYINSSNDAKLLLINKNNILYLFKSETVSALSEYNN